MELHTGLVNLPARHAEILFAAVDMPVVAPFSSFVLAIHAHATSKIVQHLVPVSGFHRHAVKDARIRRQHLRGTGDLLLRIGCWFNLLRPWPNKPVSTHHHPPIPIKFEKSYFESQALLHLAHELKTKLMNWSYICALWKYGSS